MAGLFKARLQIISTYICIKIIYTICCKNYGKQQIKNILFLLWKCLHVERKERERDRERVRGRSREEGNTSPCVSKHRQQGGEKKEGGGRRVQRWFSLDLNMLITVFFKSSPDAVWNLPTEEKQSILNLPPSLSFSHMHRIREFPLSGSFWYSIYCSLKQGEESCTLIWQVLFRP